MSRSNPTENTSHPATRWIEWDGANGTLRYYDKAEKRQIGMGDKLTFILLDQLGTVKGWHDASDSGIYSNEVKDARAQPFLVKAFKGGVLAEGFYAQIKDRVAAFGGQYVTNLYVAYRDGGSPLAIASIQFKGAALREWMEFSKANRSDLYKKAICVDGSKEGKKGSVTFKAPQFKVRDISEETNEQATALDMQLQTFLKSYLSRTTADNATRSSAPDAESEEPPIDHTPRQSEPYIPAGVDDSDLPF